MRNGEVKVLKWPQNAGHTVLTVLKPGSNGAATDSARVQASVYPLDAMLTNPLNSVEAMVR